MFCHPSWHLIDCHSESGHWLHPNCSMAARQCHDLLLQASNVSLCFCASDNEFVNARCFGTRPNRPLCEDEEPYRLVYTWHDQRTRSRAADLSHTGPLCQTYGKLHAHAVLHQNGDELSTWELTPGLGGDHVAKLVGPACADPGLSSRARADQCCPATMLPVEVLLMHRRSLHREPRDFS
jgi:hypothetical protein